MSLRNLMLGAAAAAALVAVAGAANATNTVTSNATGNAALTITVPTTVTQVTGIDFGSVARPLTGSSTVTIDASSGALASVTSGTAVQTGASHPAQFTVTGQGSSLPVHASLSFGQQDDANFGAIVATPSVTSLTFDSTYSTTIYVGAAIPVLATSAPKAYTGTLTLSVDFP